MKIGTLTLFLAVAALVALSALPAQAQGGPKSLGLNGLQKATWYRAPLEIQITDGPGVRHFSNGYRQGAHSSGAPGTSSDDLPLPPASSIQSNVKGTVNAPPPAQLASPPPLPPARFSSNAPAQNLVNRKDLPGGASTNLMGRLVKPLHVPTVVQPVQPRHLLTSHPTGSQVRHLSNWPFAQDEPAPAPAPHIVQAEPENVKRYAAYSTASAATGSSVQTRTSVSARLKRGTLLK